MTKQSTNLQIDVHTNIYNRALKKAVPGIASIEELFMLENGYYVNQDETILCKSTNETGKFFKKINNAG